MPKGGSKAGSLSKRQEQKNLRDELKKKTHFQDDEISGLMGKFSCIVKKQKASDTNTNKDINKITRGSFRDMLHESFHMTDDILLDRIFKAFDQDSDGCISEREWIEGMSIFLKGGFKEKINYAFCVYDLNGDGYISREEMFQFLKNTVSKSQNEDDQDENVKELVDQTLKKLDRDHDNRVSQNDYEEAIKDDPLLLECFGPCLPTRENKEAFLTTLTADGHRIY